MTTKAVMISWVTTSGCGMCDVLQLLSYFFINFAQVTAEFGVFLRYLTETLFFSSIDSFSVVSLFTQNKCQMVGISLVQITI